MASKIIIFLPEKKITQKQIEQKWSQERDLSDTSKKDTRYNALTDTIGPTNLSSMLLVLEIMLYQIYGWTNGMFITVQDVSCGKYSQIVPISITSTKHINVCNFFLFFYHQ